MPHSWTLPINQHSVFICFFLITPCVWQGFEIYRHIPDCDLHYLGPSLHWALILSTQQPTWLLIRYWFPATVVSIYFSTSVKGMPPFPFLSQNPSALNLRCLSACLPSLLIWKLFCYALENYLSFCTTSTVSLSSSSPVSRPHSSSCSCDCVLHLLLRLL